MFRVADSEPMRTFANPISFLVYGRMFGVWEAGRRKPDGESVEELGSDVGPERQVAAEAE